VWARSGGGTDSETALALDVLPGEAFLLSGSYGGSSVFGRGEARETTLVSSGSLDAFLARFDASGALVWARTGGGGRTEEAFGVAALSDESAIVVGRYGSLGATFGADGAGCPATLSPSASGMASTDIFVARYDAMGDLLWARKAGGTNVDGAFGVDASASDAIVVTGNFSVVATFGSVMLTMSGSMSDAFVARYTP
jgi:hypothetical protein